MFEDACCMCGKPTTGRSVVFPALEFFLCIAANHASPKTTIPIWTTTAAAVAAAFARTSMPPTPGEAPKRTPNSKHMPLFQPAIQETSPALVPRKHRPQPNDIETTLHYVRRGAHQRSASSSTTSLLLSEHYNEQTMRNMRKQQRASLPAYFSLLETPVITQSDPRIEAWPHPRPAVVADNTSVTPTIDPRGRSRAQSRSRSRGRTFARRSSHGAAAMEPVQSVVQRGRSRVPRDLVC
ncbi:hypothetical protein RSAG8_02315, partial [Rhizoctonia solani AG-8 WAC10335]